MREINLLKIRREISEKEIRLAREVKIVVFCSLIFYALLVTGILSFWLVVRRQNEQVVQKIKSQEQKIREFTQTESLHTFAKQRLSALSPLLAEEKIDYNQTLARLESFLEEGTTLTSIGLNQKGEVELTGTAANAVVFADFLKRLLSDYFADKAKLNSATREEDGSYTFTLFVNVKS